MLLFATLAVLPGVALAQQDTFQYTGNLNVARVGHTATLLNNGMVLIAGGEDRASDIFASAELYNPASGDFSTTGNLNVARSGHTATLLNNGMVLIAGGTGVGSGLNPFVPLGSAELYDPTTRTFASTGNMSIPRSGHTATLLSNGMVLIAGGFSTGTQPVASAELYDPTNGTFAVTGSLNTARSGQTATLLNSGMALFAGGQGQANPPLSDAELYNPVNGTFTTTGSLNTGRLDHTATLLNNGMVLIAAGLGANPGGAIELASAELYDPTTGTFAVTGSLNTARSGQTATLLNSGMVLLTGGLSSGTFTASAELYDPTTAICTATASLNSVRSGQTATLLDNATVLIAGGSSNTDTLARAELYELVSLVPSSLPFSNQVVGSTSAAQAVMLTNNEPTALTITSITFSGTNASDFAETDNCVGTIASGARCSMNVSFTPAALGTRAAALILTGSPLVVPLSGTGILPGPVVKLSSTSVAFSKQMVGTSSAVQMVTLSNTGTTALTIQAISIGPSSPQIPSVPGDFAMAGGTTCATGTSVAPGSSCVIQLTFTPTVQQVEYATVTITDNAADPPLSPQSIALMGTGEDFSITSPFSTATVTPGQIASYALTLSSGVGFTNPVAMSCSGAPAQASCTVSPSTVVFSGSSGNATVTVTTMAASRLGPNPFSMDDYRLFDLATELLGSYLLMGWLIRCKGGRPRLATGLALLMLLCAGITLAGCGGGTSGGGQSSGTPAGTYTLVVSGMVTSGSTTVTHSSNLTLVVK